MRIYVVLLCLVFLAPTPMCRGEGEFTSPIEHVVVLMFENHSFDNLLGWFPGVGDLDGTECNLPNPDLPPSATNKPVCTQNPPNFTTPYCTQPDPLHVFDDVEVQLRRGASGTPTMTGFVENYATVKNADLQLAMSAYQPEQLPVWQDVVGNFTTFNRWFCGIPGSTGVNRLMFHAGTSGSNNGWQYAGFELRLNATTIYNRVMDAGLTASVHYADFCSCHGILPLQNIPGFFRQSHNLESVLSDISEGTLDNLVFIVPQIFPWFTSEPTSMHPGADIRPGSRMLKTLYEALRSSEYWEKTLLLVTFDEHGGFFDKEVPPQDVPNPDPTIKSHPFPFNFESLGVRVPTIAISPWVDARVESGTYWATSASHTIRKLFNISKPLTSREAAAPTFEHLILRSEPRTDCPLTLSAPHAEPGYCNIIGDPEHHAHDPDAARAYATEWLDMYDTLLDEAGLDIGMAPEDVQRPIDAAQFHRKAIHALFPHHSQCASRHH